MAAKNPYGKAISYDKAKTDAYFIFRQGNWTWYVLKLYKNLANSNADSYARAFCLVVTPICPEGELGDVYWREVKAGELIGGTAADDYRQAQ